MGNLKFQDAVSRGFNAGNYASAYEYVGLRLALQDLDEEWEEGHTEDSSEIDPKYRDAYRNAFIVAFCGTLELHEIPSSDRETFDEAYWSDAGKECVRAGYTDSRDEDYRAEACDDEPRSIPDWSVD